MKKTFFITLITTIILTAGSYFLVETFQAGKIKKGKEMSIHMVSLRSNKTASDIIQVKVGEYVQFNSKDGKNHDLEQGHGNADGDGHEHEVGVGSGEFGPDEAYRVQFKKAGIYDFHDHLNPDIHVTIIANSSPQ